MKLFRIAAALALVAGPAFAQGAVQRYGETEKEKSPQQIQTERDAEKAYKKSLGNIPDQGPTDPWSNVRSDNSPKAAAEAPPAKRTKTGSTSN